MRRTKVVLPRPELNITPMMDLVLNLITFFVLVANFAVHELPGLVPPDPPHSLARQDEHPNHITLNVMPNNEDKGRAGDIIIGGVRIPVGDDQLEKVMNVMENEVQISSNVEVHLRADKGVRYDEIEPLLILLQNTGVPAIHVVAHAPTD